MAARVLALYRHLLRVVTKWPIDDRRPGRVMQPHLLAHTKTAFRTHRSLADSDRVAVLVAEAEHALQILRDLRANVFMQQYPIKAQPIPDMATRTLNQMSKEAERKRHPERFGLFNRIKSLLASKGK